MTNPTNSVVTWPGSGGAFNSGSGYIADLEVRGDIFGAFGSVAGTIFQSNTPNTQTNLITVPTGTATRSGLICYNNSVPGAYGQFYTDAGGVYVDASAGPLNLGVAGSPKWRIPTAGHLLAVADNTYDIGASGATRPRDMYLGGNLYATALWIDTIYAALDISGRNLTTNGDLSVSGQGYFGDKVTIDNSGGLEVIGQTKLDNNLIFNPDNTYDIGAVAANRPRTVYAATSFIGPGSVPVGGTTGQMLAKTSATNYALSWTSPLTIPIRQNLTFSPDATYDIGTNGDFQPRNLYLSGTGQMNALTVGGVARIGGALTWITDNTADIGSSGASRPRNLYLSSAVVVGLSGDMFVGNTAIGTMTAQNLSLRSNGSTRWTITTAGHLLAGVDATYDIGASGATRPRDLFLSRDLTIGGIVTAASLVTSGVAQISGQVYAALIAPRISGSGYSDGHIQILQASPSEPRIGFHETSNSALALYKQSGANRLRVRGNDNVDWEVAGAPSSIQTGQIAANAVHGTWIIQAAPSGSTTSTTAVPMAGTFGTGLTLTGYTGGQLLITGVLQFYHSAINVASTIHLYVNGADQNIRFAVSSPAAAVGVNFNIPVMAVLTLAAGAPVIQIYWSTTGGTLNSQTGYYQWLIVEELRR